VHFAPLRQLRLHCRCYWQLPSTLSCRFLVVPSTDLSSLRMRLHYGLTYVVQLSSAALRLLLRVKVAKIAFNFLELKLC
jgi:hypothetical protein